MKTENENETETEKCLSCRYSKAWEKTGSWESPEARNHWMLFGCTCDHDSACDADYWIKLISD